MVADADRGIVEEQSPIMNSLGLAHAGLELGRMPRMPTHGAHERWTHSALYGMAAGNGESSICAGEDEEPVCHGADDEEPVCRGVHIRCRW